MIIFKKEYSWEELPDIFKDIDWMLYDNKKTISSEFQGQIKVTIEYIEE